MNISGTTAVCGIIADPVGHSLSPVMHNYIAEQMGIDLVYVPFQVPVESVEAVLTGAYFMNIRGMNATLPHKSAVIPYLKEIDAAAEAIGAVNTLVRVEGGYRGCNTDYSGFARALKQNGIVPAQYPAAVVLGAGGAAKACCCLLADSGVETLYILNRTKERAVRLAEELRNGHPALRVIPAAIADWRSVLTGDGYLVIQTTSAGMYPDTAQLPVSDEDFYERIGAAYDIIYTPEETAFLKRVHAQGRKGCNGLDMLLYQGVAAFELWTGKPVPQEIARGALEEMRHALRRKKHLFFIGFMGAGKTTVGERLTDITNVILEDTDRMIEQREQTSIREIFARQGEHVFRDMETEVMETVRSGGLAPMVISVGGGLPLREENRRCMRESGTVVYLRASKETIVERLRGDSTRPLLAGGALEEKVERLMREREQIYLACADYVIDTDGRTPEEIAEEIHRTIY